MREVNITELRSRLPAYLGAVEAGEEVRITSRGRVVARLLPPLDAKAEARARLEELRGRCTVGDVIAPTGEAWEAENARP
jgi:prevent-host-death family protein